MVETLQRLSARRKANLPPVIEVSDLVVERDVSILRGIDWRVERGQHWVIRQDFAVARADGLLSAHRRHD